MYYYIASPVFVRLNLHKQYIVFYCVQRVILYVNKGDHGFHNGEMDMKTIFRAFGPDFKKNYLAEPFDSINIYPLMCKLLGVTPAPNNGSLTFTEGMLLDEFDKETPGLTDQMRRHVNATLPLLA